jgi:outer membrane immunogenic protein
MRTNIHANTKDTTHMRSIVRFALLIAILMGCASLGAAPALAQEFAAGASYNFVHSNAPPGSCGCFNMNGGSGWVSVGEFHHFSAVADVGVQYAGNINGSGVNLTLTSYVFGPRYNFLDSGRLHPFAEALVGGSHASGSFSSSSISASGSANAFAALAGGGIDFDVTEHIGVRAIEANYFFTKYDNGTNDHQNNLRIAAGIYFRFGKR